MQDWSPSSLDHPFPLRLAGFGACMITGYPHTSAGLFEVACRLIKERFKQPILSTIISLGGFPAPRAEKYLKKKVFGFNPKYIIIQFGATDAQCPIRTESRPTSKPRTDENHSAVHAAAASYHQQPATTFSTFRWQIASLIGHLRNIEPITPLSSYIAAIERMVDECRLAGIKPVVLSPFVYGSRYTMTKAIPYVDALQELNSRTPDMIFVDCIRPLATFPKLMILQHDGFHLSQLGHDLVGEEIAKAIIEDIETDGASGSNFRLSEAGITRAN